MSSRTFETVVVPGSTRDRWRQGRAWKLAIPACAGMTAFLAACSQPAERPSGEAISCTLEGEVRSCILERRGDLLIVHHPDGGFRRLRVAGDAIAVADGADEIELLAPAPEAIGVKIGDETYVIPRKPNDL